MTSSLWLPRGKTIAVTTASALDAAVQMALSDGSFQGSTIDVPSECIDVVDAMRRAARAAGARTDVRATSPTAGALFGKFCGWFGGQPPAVALYERVSTSAA